MTAPYGYGPSHSSERAAAFVSASVRIFQQLIARTTTESLRLDLQRAAECLGDGPVTLVIDAASVLANGRAVMRAQGDVWQRHLTAAGVREVDFTQHTSERELLLFFVLLTAPGDASAFGVTWLENGSWRIHVISDGDRWSGARLGESDDTPLGTPLHSLCEAVARGQKSESLVTELKTYGADATVHLLTMLRSTANGCRRRFLYEAIVAVGEGEEHLIGALQHHDWQVVRNAAALLGELKVPRAAQPLTEALRHEHHCVRAAVATSLGQLDTIEGRTALLVGVSDPHAEVRRNAWSALVLGAEAPPVHLLDGALRREEDPAVQRSLLDCASAFPDLNVAGGLIRFCAREISRRAPSELLAYGVQLLEVRRPESARLFRERLPSRKYA